MRLKRKELGASNPIATAQLTQEQKAALAQQNAAGEQVLFQCTASQYWTDECDEAILTMAQTCQESNNMPSYCHDPRFTNYISTSGGNDGIIKRIADREESERQSREEVMKRTMHIIHSQ